MTPLASCLRSSHTEDSQTFRRNRGVCFDVVTIIEFPYIVGDNPAVSSGVPLAIGQEGRNKVVWDMDVYEYMRPSCERRNQKELLLPMQKRASILIDEGYSLLEIADAVIEVEKIRRHRQVSSLKFTEPGPFGRVINLVTGAKPMAMWAKSA